MSAFALLMTLAWFHGRQAGYPHGWIAAVGRGGGATSSTGGVIDYRARVTEIVVENDRAVGVRLEDGREERSDVVVSAADGHATIFDMLKGRYVDDTVRGWFDDYLPFPPLVFVGLGVNRTFPEEPRLVSGASLGLTEPIRIGRIVDRLFLPSPQLRSQPGARRKDRHHLHAGRRLDTGRTGADHERYETGEEGHRRRGGEGPGRRFPGLAGLVEMVDVATPTTFERYTGNWRASFEGWLPTPANLSADMRRTLPGLDSFYMVGQWVAPGGGLPSGVMTGREVVQLMCHKDNRTSAPRPRRRRPRAADPPRPSAAAAATITATARTR